MSTSAPSMRGSVYPTSGNSGNEVGDETTTPAVLPSPQSGEDFMHAQNIVIIIIFCAVCFLLMVAFFYAFCFRCTLQSSPKDSRTEAGCSVDREDATFRCSSSGLSLGNTI